MSYSPIAIKRSYILGKIYHQCEPIESIPVYLNESLGEPLGYADESLGHYADAFKFNLPETFCKNIAENHYEYSFGFEYFKQTMPTVGRKKIRLKYILLIERKLLFVKKKLLM